MLLRGIKLPVRKLDAQDVQTTRERAARTGRSHGGVQLRQDRGGRMNFGSSRDASWGGGGQHHQQGYANNSHGYPPPVPPPGWVPPPPGLGRFGHGPPPPPPPGHYSRNSGGYPDQYPRGNQYPSHLPPPPPQYGNYNNGGQYDPRGGAGYNKR